MPLIEPTCAVLALLGGDVRREMELLMVDSLYLKVGWERVVVLGESAAAEYVDLRLYWNSWALRDAVDVDSFM